MSERLLSSGGSPKATSLPKRKLKSPLLTSRSRISTFIISSLNCIFGTLLARKNIARLYQLISRVATESYWCLTTPDSHRSRMQCNSGTICVKLRPKTLSLFWWAIKAILKGKLINLK